MSVPLSDALVDAVRNARRIAVLTGAGVSAESGIPTFRDAQTGLWARFRPEDLATVEAFERDPKLVWEWYAWRRRLVSEARPNPGHVALARLQSLAPSCTVITQNVDGLHQKAGSREVIELHGSIQRCKCHAEGRIVTSWPEGEAPPRCPHCGAYLRPDVVWFGEMLPPDALAGAESAARSSDLFLSIGTSALVFPAAQLPVTALRSGATVIEINKDPTPLSAAATYSVRAAAGEALPALVRAAWGADLSSGTPS